MTDQRTRTARLMPFLIAAIVVLADRVSKIWIQHSMSLFDSVSLIPGWFRIVHTENPGAAFGFMAESNSYLRSAVLVGMSTIVLFFVASALWGRGSSFTGIGARLGLSLVLGGAVGNLYDRIAHGTVTDFVEVYHGTWFFPAFNVADSAITVGAILLLMDLLLHRQKPVEESTGFAHK
ncbi:MAG: signal peptidase II [Bryobacteraceae bacterium]